ncbi:MAG: ATP-binding protein [Actinomycetota bacterium]|nr:ATP-binding protein [Actinomycetota bacterium]
MTEAAARAGAVPSLLTASAVVVLVGAAASGKTTLRRQLAASGTAPSAVISLDDERLALRERDLAVGREPRELQDYSWAAVQRSDEAARELLSRGLGYIADATHLRRRERVPHLRDAHAAGLVAIAMLLPAVPLDVLRERNTRRPAFRRVPDDILERHAHRRSLLTPELLLEEGFDQVVEAGDHDAIG